ncbi:MAG: FUN14 domain-containing protein [Planctomycetota bacterium]
MTDDTKDLKTVPKPSMPRWKWALLGFAALLVVVGLILSLTAPEPEPVAPPALPDGVASSFVGEGGKASQTGASSGSSSWAPGFMKMGFSFFAGFAMGAVLRAFLKMTVIFVGLLFLAMAGLSYLGLVTVHWEHFDQLWQTFSERVSGDFGNLQTTLTGSLPQAGLGSLGLFAGVKKG